ncbi:class A basic helix-loop-helix protein 15-like [Dendronephthya gigantea]|uniref:class A basic helix-loop-helix protein 15-like n=1 Tax=Dendronephthya gigantea TaxID=151771 RepID=UPI00106CF79C|nr:class A basic helix-loop-helix protein 15-like [Dendronephthya gigantea]
MDSFHTQGVRVDISVAFKPELHAGNDEIFAKEFLAAFPTRHNCSSPQKETKKTRTNVSKIKTTNLTEKSPRQERRNARERGRKARLNAAFQVLRSMVPHNADPDQEQRKLTQVEILRLAKNYISSLTTILETCNDNIAFCKHHDRQISATRTSNLYTN